MELGFSGQRGTPVGLGLLKDGTVHEERQAEWRKPDDDKYLGSLAAGGTRGARTRSPYTNTCFTQPTRACVPNTSHSTHTLLIRRHIDKPRRSRATHAIPPTWLFLTPFYTALCTKCVDRQARGTLPCKTRETTALYSETTGLGEHRDGRSCSRAAAAPAKAPKKKAASRAKKAGPSVGELIVKAVSSSKERSGVSLAALKKALRRRIRCGEEQLRVKLAVKSLVVKGTLLQTKGTGASGSFKLNKKQTEAKKPAKKTATKAKKPVAVKAKKPAAAKKPKKVAAKKPVAAAKKSPKKAKKPAAAAKKVAKSPKKAKKPATPKKAAKSPKKAKTVKPKAAKPKAAKAKKTAPKKK
ncbi:hypothetical protein HF521_022240 [Silurus meridionalis]|uniref:H15 domain-containing protein n=1 Tax=Silurus meridionalis TaxID=175797 RepID=A0A8T0BBC6_SILME|nr:hypothetical protein HF521_022240 [Silurus meridionalis]